MKRIKVYSSTTICMILWIFIGTQLLGCRVSVAQTTSERNLPAFNELSLCISADVVLTQGSTQKVNIMASDKVLKQIETEVNDGRLTIKWTDWFVTNTEKITIYITMVEVNALKVSGSGDIVAADAITSNDIQLSVSGSGNIKLDNLKADNIKSSISGSANISISGSNTASSLSAAISGSGDIKAKGILVKNVDIAVSGSGDCSVNALETIKARVSGSGDIYYSGSATVDARVSGSGTVQHVN